mmetsp:Transcript_22684/g.51870  ORF Transcript_22684/g.51870 Transcript_22684/m.51870 type:complete len:268 (-) Transcript_22684:33-836(-)
MSGRRWKIVGGADKGGILVRGGRDLGTPQLSERLATGALVEQLELIGDRLHFRRLEGAGPDDGWVSLRLPSGKELLAPAEADGSSGPPGDRQESPWPTHPLEESEWEERLGPAAYAVLRDKVTEPRGSGEYDKFFPSAGHFRCGGCEIPLYSASAKMQGGCGWPAFSRCYADADDRPRVVAQVDWVAGGREILCRQCGGHLGHVFMDGDPERHCVNSLSILYDEGPAPSPEGGGKGPPREGLVDMTTFTRQLHEHSKTGSYDGVVDP